MWLQRDHSEKKDCSNSLVAVAIDKDNKGSQFALKWAVENLLVRGQTVVLINVKAKTPPSHSCVTNPSKANDSYSRELFLPFRCLCTRKDIQSKEIVLEEADVTKSLIDFVNKSAIDVLVMGAASKGGFLSRFGKADIPNSVSKGAPDFCTVYVISKGKISSMRSSTRPAPQTSALRDQIANSSTPSVPASPAGSFRGLDRPMPKSPPYGSEDMNFRSPFNKGGGGGGGRQPKSYLELLSDSDVSFISSGRTSVDRMYPPIFDSAESAGRLSTNRLSTSSDISLDGPFDAPRRRSVDTFSASEFSGISSDDGTNFSWSSNYGQEDADAEMRRLKLELKQTMDMYSNACKEAVTAKQKAMELQKWKIEEEKKVEETRLAEETVKAVAEKEKTNARAALEAAEASKRIAELESQKRVSAEMRALKDTEERKKTLNKMKISPARYRKYTIDEIEAATEFFQQSRKIGEGGYGPVYKAYLDHTQVAIKVLRPDAAQGRAQFQQEVEILSCIRHPNMVLLLGACPEYGCLVYEYMHNGSLEDRLFCKGGTPPIPWQHRFRIAAEIAIGLLFLHQTKPEPLVHRDLKPANILLDRNMVSKISDVGLARLVPPSVADSVTQYRMTATAGTFCYIDPEYQQTGMLGVKSDVYSLGVMLLQIITAKPPMGLTHYVEQAIETDTFKDMLDPAVKDWPVEEALKFAKLAIQCAELRRRDRPDLCSVILPELNRLKMLGEESIDAQGFSGVECFAQTASHISVQQDVMSCPPSQCDSERSS